MARERSRDPLSAHAWLGYGTGGHFALAPRWLRSRCAVLLRNLALQDILIVTYQGYLCMRMWLAPDGDDAWAARHATTSLLAITLITLMLTRGEVLSRGFHRAALYRAGMFVPMFASYFALRSCLPALHPHLLDAQLYHLDQRLFGETPALWLDRFVSVARVEWFAFFYYGYFIVIAVHLLGALLLDSGHRQYEMLFGAAVVVAAGHTLYTVVPGVGPHTYAHELFRHALIGGPWWARVQRAVRAEGAMLDIFPSLHTALPVLFALHAVRHRRHTPYRQTWPLLLFVTLNIVVATMFLRWHYGVDVVAGVALAFCAQRLAVLGHHVEAAREQGGALRQPVWESLVPRGMRPQDFHVIVGLIAIHLAVLALGLLATIARAS